jgi:biopolymer transport protein ExbB/TolQ
MNCTAYGLIVAIPAVVAYAVLTNRSLQLAEELNRGSLKIFNWLSYAYEPIPATTGKPNARSERGIEA